jgi:hypothetical protein
MIEWLMKVEQVVEGMSSFGSFTQGRRHYLLNMTVSVSDYEIGSEEKTLQHSIP